MVPPTRVRPLSEMPLSAACGTLLGLVEVKNTFVHIESRENVSPIRRNRSLPRSTRLFAEDATLFAAEDDSDGDEWSDIGTVYSSVTSTSQISDTTEVNVPVPPKVAPRFCNTGSVEVDFDSAIFTLKPSDISASSTSSGRSETSREKAEQPKLCLSDLVEKPRKTPLKAHARRFSPVSSKQLHLCATNPAPQARQIPVLVSSEVPVAFVPQSRPSGAGCFQDAIAEITTSLQSALSSYEFVDVSISGDNSVWKCVATIPEESSSEVEDELLSRAMHVYLEAAQKSAHMRPICFNGEAITRDANGFGASLGSVVMESRACWDFYGAGFCWRGCACSWEHPRHWARIEVTVEKEMPAPR